MQFDANNNVVNLCAQGMAREGEGKKEEALNLFQQAWNEATNDFERFTAAHYVARHQQNISDKLKWDKIALRHALKINDEIVKETLPSLYLNIGKCFEDLHDIESAKKHFELAFTFTAFLPDNGYGNMIKSGINSALERSAAR